MTQRLARSLAFGLIATMALSGCVRTAASIVTAPVRVAGKAVDWTTTSQSEADEKRGREMRKRDEQIGKLDKRYQKHLRDCRSGSEDACNRARDDYAEMQELRSGPY
ncbi:hypothetical protein [Novosphingobium resinovorum]|uniref:hypothetical protein n=1 Tax=Novosphingobium resinovorum TaxID=158500 RepID=UPI002ED192EA|nr:hypothetical protein [Novosphingobium resinovorum]